MQDDEPCAAIAQRGPATNESPREIYAQRWPTASATLTPVTDDWSDPRQVVKLTTRGAVEPCGDLVDREPKHRAVRVLRVPYLNHLADPSHLYAAPLCIADRGFDPLAHGSTPRSTLTY